MLNDFERGMLCVLLFLLLALFVFAFGYSVRKEILKEDIKICGHTLECYEKLVFPPKTGE